MISDLALAEDVKKDYETFLEKKKTTGSSSNSDIDFSV